MSASTILCMALIAPAVFALPVPQYGWPSSGSYPVGTATMGGLTSSITTENGGFSYAGPPRPEHCQERQQGCAGNGIGGEWRGNRGNENNWPSVGNSYDKGYQGGSTSTTVTTSGPGGITSSSQSYKKTKRHQPEPPQSQGYGQWLNSVLSNHGNGKPSNTPVGTVAMGGLTSSITLGSKKRQVDVAALGGPESTQS